MKGVMLLLISLMLLSCSGKRIKGKYTTKKIDGEWKFIFEKRKQYFLHLENCKTLTAIFKYKNTTGRVQNIDTIKTACACTNVCYRHKPIKPGEEGYISFNVDLGKYSGFFSKSIGVYFHNQPPVVLTVLGKNVMKE